VPDGVEIDDHLGAWVNGHSSTMFAQARVTLLWCGA
jgi:hypothetical protein